MQKEAENTPKKNPTAQSHDTFWHLYQIEWLGIVVNNTHLRCSWLLAFAFISVLAQFTVKMKRLKISTIPTKRRSSKASNLRRLLFWTGDHRNHLGHVALSVKENFYRSKRISLHSRVQAELRSVPTPGKRFACSEVFENTMRNEFDQQQQLIICKKACCKSHTCPCHLGRLDRLGLSKHMTWSILR